MTDEQFDIRMQQIEDQRKAGQKEVDGKYEQSLAKLFHKSEWTQQRIADKVGKSVSQVSRLLIYGRFLASANNSPTGEKFRIRSDVTEREFRKHWEATKKQPKEEKRFLAVLKSMESEGEAESKNEEKSLRGKIISATKSGFKSKNELMELVGCSKSQIQDSLDHMGRGSAYEVHHNNGSIGHRKYKIVRAGRRVALSAIYDKIEPILEALEEQGRVTSMADYAPPEIRAAVLQLRKLLEEFAK